VTRVKGHHLHIVLKDGKQILLARPGKLDNQDSPALPAKLTFEARWIYNFTTGKVLKNSSDKAVIPVHDAEEVDSEWLKKRGYIVEWPRR
jgi:predicted RNA binding protein YcfA (HicA-like mRNA interferase family)